MRGFAGIGLALAAVLAGLNAAQAGDAAARHVLGFSPDGRYFAFEQYTTFYEDEAALSEYVVVDTTTDRYVQGTPVTVLIRGEDGLDEKKAREAAAAKAKPLLTNLRIGASGARVAGQPSIVLDEIGIYQSRTAPLAKSLRVPLSDGRSAELTIVTRPIAMATCEGYGGRATPGKAMGQGLTLTMTVGDAKPVTLHSDKALPNKRRCAASYGIAEAYLHTAPEGAVTLAVLIEIEDNAGYHAGPNRRFMVVTRRLSPP